MTEITREAASAALDDLLGDAASGGASAGDPDSGSASADAPSADPSPSGDGDPKPKRASDSSPAPSSSDDDGGSARRPSARKSMEDMLKEIEDEDKRGKAAADFDLEALAMKQARQVLRIDEPRGRHERRALLVEAIKIRDRMKAARDDVASAAPAPPASATGTDDATSGSSDPNDPPTAVLPRVRHIVDLDVIPIAEQDAIREMIDARIGGIERELEGVVVHLSDKKFGKYTRKEPVTG